MKHAESRTRTWQKWRELVGRQRSSGLSVASFCARNGLAESSLYAWRRRVAAARVFVEAEVADGPAGPRPAGVGMVEVRVRGGRRLRVRCDSFDRDLLLAVVAALEGLPGLPRGAEADS
jgi:hypothetical protein